MATRKPIVLGADGRFQQLQSADTLGITSETGQLAQTADATLIAGNAVYQSAADHVNKGQANAAGTAFVTGLAVAAITSGQSGLVQYDGVVTLTTAQWDAVAGTTGGLTFNVTYYLDPATAGKLTSACPTTVGQYVVIVGKAISTTELVVKISEPVLL